MTILSILGLTFFTAILFTFVAAWMNEKIIRVEKQKRKFAEVLQMLIIWGLVALLVWDKTSSYLLAGIVFLMPIALRYAFFDPILNKLMGWAKDFKGTTSVVDILEKKIKIPFWLRYVALVVFVTGIIIIYLFKF